jgi:hypothetical protein
MPSTLLKNERRICSICTSSKRTFSVAWSAFSAFALSIHPTRRMKPGRAVVIWRVDLPFLEKDGRKYEGSTAAQGSGGRTHTFGIKSPATLIRAAIAYQAPQIGLSQGKPSLIDTSLEPQG